MGTKDLNPCTMGLLAGLILGLIASQLATATYGKMYYTGAMTYG
jgi:hypothetical protein